MKQIARILTAIAALGLLTVYFFSDLVLIEPAQRILGNGSLDGSSLVAFSDEPTSALVHREAEHIGGSARNTVPRSPVFRGITGSSGGMISTFRAKWQRVYDGWPTGKIGLHKRGKMSGDSIVQHDRVGILLTLIILVIGIGVISLTINRVEEKARL